MVRELDDNRDDDDDDEFFEDAFAKTKNKNKIFKKNFLTLIFFY